MQAMIFAAGLGTRLAPLTDNKPKALVEFQGKPMIENVIEKLVKAGFNRIIVNVHHFADMVCDFLKSKNFGAEILISDERDFLLDTGGGLLKARPLLENAPHTLLYNVDVFSTIDVKDLYDCHVKKGALATLAVKQRETFRKFVFTNFDELCGWVNTKTGEEVVARSYAEDYAYKIPFCGISVVSSKIFPLITETGKFSIKDLYLRLAEHNRIIPYLCSGSVLWADLGTPEKINAISEILAHNRNLLNVEH